MGRSILAIVVGFVLVGLLSFGGDAAFRAAGLLPPAGERVTDVGMLLLTQVYVAVAAILGCYVCARLAPDKPMKHALILGALGFVFNVVGFAATWGQVPVWYNVLALALVMPYAWIGGRIRERELARSGGARAAATS